MKMGGTIVKLKTDCVVVEDGNDVNDDMECSEVRTNKCMNIINNPRVVFDNKPSEQWISAIASLKHSDLVVSG